MQTCDWTSVIQNASVTIASLAAIFGIDAWRREHVGKRRMELAEEVLALFYQARDVIHAMRSPFGFGGEGTTRKADSNESPEDKEALDQAYVVVERYNKHLELFSRIHALRYRFMAQIGTTESKPFDDLSKVINEIFLASRRFWRRKDSYLRAEEDEETYHNKFRELQSILWEGEDPDPIQERVDALIADIELTCRGILSSKGTLFGLINLPLWKGRRS